MASTTDAGSARHGRLSRSRWIEAALDVLVSDGIGGVRIERLCRSLGVTKGSFYHHFAGRDDLLAAVADHWADTQPRDAVESLASGKADPRKQLVEVTRLVADRDIGRRDHAMRAWTAADPRAARAVQRADRQILKLLEQILAGMGVADDEIHPLARVLFFTALGAYDAPALFDGRSGRSLSRYLLRLVKDRALAD